MLDSRCCYTRRILEIVLGFAVVLIIGCGSTPISPVSSLNNYDYVVGPGDSLEIFVWGNQELTTMVTVRPDGKITTRLVEDVIASGKTSTELARDIEKAYSEYVKTPIVSVIVNGFVGVPAQQIRVVGEAVKPLRVPFSKHMTLLDLMIAVGGLTEYADGNDSILIRIVNGEQKTFDLRLEDLLRDGDISANLALLPGDIVIIPESWF